MIFLVLLKYFQKSSFLFGYFWVQFEVKILNLFFHYLLKIEAAYLFLQVEKLIFVCHYILFGIFPMGHISHVLWYESYDFPYYLDFLYYLAFLVFLHFFYFLHFLYFLHFPYFLHFQYYFYFQYFPYHLYFLQLVHLYLYYF